MSIKGYEIDYSAKVVYANYKFYERATKDFTSAEAQLYRAIVAEMPGFKLVARAGKEITTPRETKNLTYKNMEKHIALYENSEDLLAMFEAVKKLSAPVKSRYKFVRDWFTEQFPDYNKIPTFTIVEGNVKIPAVKIVNAPNVTEYKQKAA